ncbi:hypothetical protein SISSUDRAFT_1087959 [Sistotremastrum suecicum HHB10207 ss-3]|uniref:Uncharacterized protein n=1 Tax=Sistotremastrum suecicum HHB10207 ss-3 TaxID=1314776 RepID=A0A165Z1S3_9AGAM|nr:hypothetical protein SISSUDRAFT_1087959 [Sistotremastrum suecicum HHB10207 ss-3]
MHLASLNIPQLFISLWTGKGIDAKGSDSKDDWREKWCTLTDTSEKDPRTKKITFKNYWTDHGKEVAATRQWIPGSFDRTPRDIAKKLNSGYKAWEFTLYFYGLGPCLLFERIKLPYWRNYCRFVHAMRLMLQHEVSMEECRDADRNFIIAAGDFEDLYIERRTDRLHFGRPCLHAPLHIPGETARVGPQLNNSQWTMERTIGNLGQEIRQHQSVFANLAQRALYRCQVNTLFALLPDFAPPPPKIPRGAKDLGGGYVLLCAHDLTKRVPEVPECEAIKSWYRNKGATWRDDLWIKVSKWARLRLPIGQVARCSWKENKKRPDQVRAARNVKVLYIH